MRAFCCLGHNCIENSVKISVIEFTIVKRYNRKAHKNRRTCQPFFSVAEGKISALPANDKKEPAAQNTTGFTCFYSFKIKNTCGVRTAHRRCGPSDRSRTCGLLNPIQARYQTALHPDNCRSYYIT